MSQTQKDFTALVRGVKKALHSAHGITVPYTALRAALLQAQGEHPHARSMRREEDELHQLKALVTEAPNYFAPQYDFDGAKLRWLERAGLVPSGTVEREQQEPVEFTLYLASDEVGCLKALAFDAEGSLLLPEDWCFKAGTVSFQHAEVPSIRRYGLPDYLARAKEFYQQFGLTLAADYRAEVADLQDDSGDACWVLLRVPRTEAVRLMEEVLRASSASACRAATAEWVGLNYRRNFDAEPRAKKLEWLERYLLKEAPTRDYVEAVFEWVYPDEDGDHLPALVDLPTGKVTCQGTLPRDIQDPSVRVRIWTGAECGEGDDILAVYRKPENAWFVDPKAINS